MAGTNLGSAVNSTLVIRETTSDGTGLALTASCTGAPPTTANVFSHGCIMVRTDSGTGNKAVYENTGSSASPSWDLIGAVAAGEITLAEGNVLVGNNSGVASALSAKTSGQILIGNGTTITSAAVSGDAALSSAGAVTVTKINSKAVSHVPMFGGAHADGGGSATITITITGALATDLGFAQLSASTNAVSVQKVTMTSDTMTILLSGDPGAATNVNYLVVRAA